MLILAVTIGGRGAVSRSSGSTPRNMLPATITSGASAAMSRIPVERAMELIVGRSLDAPER